MKQKTKEIIKSLCQEALETNEVAGISVMLRQKGQEVFYMDYGWAEYGKKKIHRDTIYRLYSMTKPVTAAALMWLMEKGKIDLYDSVSRYLPGFKDQRVETDTGDSLVPVERDMMIKDLLSMTSGLVYGGDDLCGKKTEELFKSIDERLLSDHPMTTLEAMNSLGGIPLKFQPGSSWEYGLSADVLGAIVEVASGESFSSFLEKHFFGPMDMKDTGFYVAEQNRHRLAFTYASSDSGMPIYTGNHLGIINAMDRIPAYESGGAGLVSTIDDYSKFADMLLNKGVFGKKRILSERAVNYMTSGQLSMAQQKSFDTWTTLAGHTYRNLMRILDKPAFAGDFGFKGEYGWDGWLGTYFVNCPKQKLTLLVMMQRKDAGTTRLTRSIRNVLFASL